MLSILEHGVFLLSLLMLAFVRLRFRTHGYHRRRHRIAPDHMSDCHSLAGVPLRILLSDRSGPGAVLRDTLRIRPSSHD